MPALLLRLAAPIQSWGEESKFDARRTRRFPTKSGVIGMLAAALGIPRDEPLDDRLNKLKFGVRADSEGTVIEDFHIAKNQKSSERTYLTYREYLCDAVFLVALESDDREFLFELEYALKHPVYPLFLGRRSCPPTLPIVLEISDKSAEECLQTYNLLLSSTALRRLNADSLNVQIVIDDVQGSAVQRDVPVSFDPTLRKYGFRTMSYYNAEIPVKKSKNSTEHDIMSVI